MKTLLFSCILLTLLGAVRTQSADRDDSPGWIDLTPGKDLKGWKRVVLPPDTRLNAKDPWKLDGAVLQCDGVGVKEMLLHDREFGDGTFHVEWRFRKVEGQKEYNSGVYVRTTGDGKLWHQVQVAHQEKPPLLGDLFGDSLVKGKPDKVLVRGEASKHARPVGEWNIYEITTRGKTVEVRTNGAKSLTWDECPLEKGHVGLQAEFSFIEFRNLKFKPAR